MKPAQPLLISQANVRNSGIGLDHPLDQQFAGEIPGVRCLSPQCQLLSSGELRGSLWLQNQQLSELRQGQAKSAHANGSNVNEVAKDAEEMGAESTEQLNG